MNQLEELIAEHAQLEKKTKHVVSQVRVLLKPEASVYVDCISHWFNVGGAAYAKFFADDTGLDVDDVVNWSFSWGSYTYVYVRSTKKFIEFSPSNPRARDLPNFQIPVEWFIDNDAFAARHRDFIAQVRANEAAEKAATAAAFNDAERAEYERLKAKFS